MAYAITQTCCTDASCVSVCPVNCIHPTPDEPDFGRTDMLYVDPQTCIDCGACADACPVDAIFPVDRLRGADTEYARMNREYYETADVSNEWTAPNFPRSLPEYPGTLRVAIVGTGPAACYTAQALLRDTGAEITMLDRLPLPGGLLRSGVAPDHQSTKKIADGFSWLYQHPRLRMHMNVEVGRDVAHEDLAAHHHAVIYAVGAATDRELGVDGEDLPGSVSATSFVSWYNAHPDFADLGVDLSAERAVVVGNGNVALDVARILLSDPEELAGTDIADHALERLRGSRVREVVLLARRGPEHAAFTAPEFHAMRHLPGVRAVVEDGPEVRKAFAEPEPGGKAQLLAELPVEDVDLTEAPADGKRLVFRFGAAPAEVRGTDRVRSVRVRDGGEIATGLLVRAIGYRATPIAGLPFDESTATVPNRGGRVLDAAGNPLPGTYVVGWAKRGPSGGIGTNRGCARDTVGSLLDDAAAGHLREPAGSGFDRLVRARAPRSIGRRGMLNIDRAERERGERTGRPRVKFATVPELLGAARRFGR
ncbi:FAD-dependent oxidoreductase [Saccharopolyspora sp. 7B]|uniref:FAD-dependent oxidoreductase n=2 Tax=unclassified Saccharopolyspora TaxID=2646250 RepID=UPI001CD1B5E8|nr:FAD-dependent oxidoreductase [Saccharopolyspora sp. 7B]MCA1279125.1 FAD-dependent oxidoreductase [Saccharopolyspora sp. 7B]